MGKRVDWAEVAELTLSLTPSIFGMRVDLGQILRAFRESGKDLDEKVEEATTALRQASRVVEELQTEVQEELQHVNELKGEYEKYKGLASIEKEKAKQLLVQLQELVGSGKTRERWIAFGINLLAGLLVFVLGVVLSPHVRTLFGVGS